MAIIDGLLLFTGTSNGATGTIADGLYTDAPTTGTQNSSNVIDIGLNGIPNSANGGGARDLGIGDNPSLKLQCYVETAFTGGTSLQLVLYAAVDNGSGAPSSYHSLWAGQVFAEAALIAGAQLANIDLPRVPFEWGGQAPGLPRFFLLDYVSVGTHSGGDLAAAIVMDREDQIIGLTGAMSGYQAGINVAN